MQIMTAIISETLCMEVEQIVSVRYKSANVFTVLDNCGDSYTITVAKS